MNLKAAIFDFDGTLFDSMHVWETAGSDYLCSIGRVPHEGLDSRLKTMSLAAAAAFIREKYELPLTVNQVADGVNRTVEKAYFYSVQPKESVIDFLTELKGHDVDMCVATATDRYQIEAALKRCGMLEFFKGVLTCSEVGHGKEDPEIFRQALKLLGSGRENSVVFEDALHALMTAKNDGFVTAGVYDSHEQRQDLLRASADFFLPDMRNFNLFWKQVQERNS